MYAGTYVQYYEQVTTYCAALHFLLLISMAYSFRAIHCDAYFECASLGYHFFYRVVDTVLKNSTNRMISVKYVGIGSC